MALKKTGTTTIVNQVGIEGIRSDLMFDTQFNVYKRLENIIYSRVIPEDAVNIAYVGVEPLIPKNVLVFNDKSGDIPNNGPTSKVTEVKFDFNTISYYTNSFLLTDVTNQGIEDNIEVPFYYKHAFFYQKPQLDPNAQTLSLFNANNGQIIYATQNWEFEDKGASITSLPQTLGLPADTVITQSIKDKLVDSDLLPDAFMYVTFDSTPSLVKSIIADFTSAYRLSLIAGSPVNSEGNSFSSCEFFIEDGGGRRNYYEIKLSNSVRYYELILNEYTRTTVPNLSNILKIGFTNFKNENNVSVPSGTQYELVWNYIAYEISLFDPAAKLATARILDKNFNPVNSNLYRFTDQYGGFSETITISGDPENIESFDNDVVGSSGDHGWKTVLRDTTSPGQSPIVYLVDGTIFDPYNYTNIYLQVLLPTLSGKWLFFGGLSATNANYYRIEKTLDTPLVLDNNGKLQLYIDTDVQKSTSSVLFYIEDNNEARRFYKLDLLNNKPEKTFSISNSVYLTENGNIDLTNIVKIGFQDLKHNNLSAEPNVFVGFDDIVYLPPTVEDTIITENLNAIYTNLKNSYNEDNGDYEIYYVEYRWEDEQTTRLEVLNTIPAFDKARLEYNDYNDNNLLKQNRKIYSIEQVGNNFDITVPVPGRTYYLKPVDRNRMQLNYIQYKAPGESWFVSIYNSSFVYKNKLYNIPEYNDQSFTIFPIKKIYREQALWVDKNICKIQREGLLIILPTLSIIPRFDIDIIIKDSSGKTIKLATTRQLSENEIEKEYQDEEGNYTGLFWNRNGIQSYDSLTGFVKLNFDIQSDWNILCTYYRVANDYEYIERDINPIINQDIRNTKLVFYIKSGASEKSLYHLVVNEDDIIIDSNDKDIQLSGMKYSTTLGSFSALYTINGTNGKFNNNVNNQFGNFFILGEIVPKDSNNISDTTVIDIRKRGGGVKEKYYNEFVDIFPQIKWFYDIGNWDGQAYPGNSVVFINLPRTILKEYGGNFEHNDVIQQIKKHISSGVYPLIRYYSIQPYITSVTTSNNSVTLEWTNENTNITSGNEIVYRVLVSKDHGRTWKFYDPDTQTLINEDGILPTAFTSNMATIQSLNDFTVYTFSIIAYNKDNIAGERSKYISVVPTTFLVKYLTSFNNEFTVNTGELFTSINNEFSVISTEYSYFNNQFTIVIPVPDETIEDFETWEIPSVTHPSNDGTEFAETLDDTDYTTSYPGDDGTSLDETFDGTDYITSIPADDGIRFEEDFN